MSRKAKRPAKAAKRPAKAAKRPAKATKRPAKQLAKSTKQSAWQKPGWEKRAQKFAEPSEPVKKKSQKPARRVRVVRAPAKLPEGVKRVYRYVTKSGRFTRKRKGAKRRAFYFSTPLKRLVSKKDLWTLLSYQKAQKAIEFGDTPIVKEAIEETYRTFFDWIRDNKLVKEE